METIVLGLVTYQGRVLVGRLQQSVRKDFGNVPAVMPGGRITASVDLETSIRQKILKETGLEVVVQKKIGERVHPLLPDKRMIYFHCEAVSGVVRLPDGEDIESFGWEDVFVASQLMLTLYSRVFSYLLRIVNSKSLMWKRDVPKLAWLQQSFQNFGDKLRKGELVAFPTETVYGLGANAYDEKAVAKIFSTKGRPADNPLIVHISSAKKLDSVVAELSPLAEQLYQVFSPGPLTVILPKRKDIPNIVTANLPWVGVRIPNHGIALEFLAAAQVPVAAPSANVSGKPSATHHKHVKQAFKEKVPNIIKAGTSLYGVESTVVKVINEEKVAILRQGAISKEAIQQAFPAIEVVLAGQEDKNLKASPGTRYKHYAPQAKIEIIPYANSKEVAAQLQKRLQQVKGKTAIAVADEVKKLLKIPKSIRVFSLGSLQNPAEAVQKLYDILISCDNFEITHLLVHGYEESGLGRTFMERIGRAASDFS